ncbi:MAG: hypothetical protein ACLTE4_01590 [Christensenellaceae bacterium]|jgi:hypothetical protein
MIRKRTEKFDEIMYRAICTTVRDTLEDILKTEYKKPTAEGKETIDYEMTVRVIRSKARIALDLIAKIEEQDKK